MKYFINEIVTFVILILNQVQDDITWFRIGITQYGLLVFQKSQIGKEPEIATGVLGENKIFV